MANNGKTKRLQDTLYGYPFHEENDLSQSELYFGDWAFYIIGDRQTVSVKTTTEGGDAWRRNGLVYISKFDRNLTIPQHMSIWPNIKRQDS